MKEFGKIEMKWVAKVGLSRGMRVRPGVMLERQEAQLGVADA